MTTITTKAKKHNHKQVMTYGPYDDEVHPGEWRRSYQIEKCSCGATRRVYPGSALRLRPTAWEGGK